MYPNLYLLASATLALGLSTAAARAQSAAQGFEGAATDTWTYTATPASYNVPADNDQWAVLSDVGTTGTNGVQATPTSGTRLWGLRDIQGPPTNDVSTWHFLDFAPVAVQNGSGAATTVTFKYFSNAFDAPDSLAYAVQFDNGTAWPLPRTYVQLGKDTRAWTTVTVSIPAGSSHVRLRLAARQNGNDDWAAWDDVALSSAAPPLPTLRLTAGTVSVNENAGTASLTVSIQNPGAAPATVQAALLTGLGTATAGPDFTFAAPQTLTFPAGSAASQTISIPLTDDALAEPAEYFALRLQNPSGATLAAGGTEALFFIKDNDATAPTQARNLTLRHLGSYQNGASGTNSAEIVVHDPSTQRLYVANSVGGKLDILSLANPAAITPVASISMAPYGGLNSVAVRGGVVACAVENAAPQSPGAVVFFNQDGVFQKQVTVGAMPDMISFSPNGQYLLTANEGEPNAAYTNDPEGSVSVIDYAGGLSAVTQASVTTVGFTGYNGQATTLRAAGIRLYGGTATTPSTVAQDFEPEYVAFDPSSATAYITLQENNAIATLDLTTKQFTGIRTMGYQDHSQPGFALDASDQAADVLIANWPIRGLRLPDALAAFQLPGSTATYLITANEGDAREYTALTEGVRLGSAAYPLDPTAFPQAALLKDNSALGRLNVTNKLGDTDGDGDFDEIYSFGGRSFSILNAQTGAVVHDSGDLLERLTSTDLTYAAIFNASNTTGTPARKNRSDDKGPEPEGVTTAVLRDTVYAFVSLERMGGVAVFDVNNPAQPRLVQYVNNRSVTAGSGDQGPEGIVFVSAQNSPTGQPLLLLANEVSSTVAVYGVELRGTVLSSRNPRRAAPLHFYPNPAQGGTVQLSRAVSGTLTDALGRPVRQLSQASRLETAGLPAGVYVLRTADGASSKLVVR